MSWFGNPEFWQLFYDWMFPDQSFQHAKAQIDDLIALTGIREGALLDLCCGPGRYSVPFAQRGFRVTGVDLQPFLLEKAKDYCDRENAHVELVQADMLTFKRVNAFDLIINMFSSFGYFNDPADDLQVLENIHTSLKPGGKLLLDVRGKEIHAMANINSFSQEMPNGDLIFHRIEVIEDWTKTQSEWVHVRGDQAKRFQMGFNLYSGAELKALIQRVGFSHIQLYGDCNGSPYDQNAQRLIALATK